MIIPWQQLSADALQGLLESYVQREGTDYGEVEWDFSAKVEQVRSQVKNDSVLIVFDEASESVNLLSREDYDQALLAAKPDDWRD